MPGPSNKLIALHGGYYIATGLWPLVSRRTFERVTGPKRDFWLAQTVAVLVASVGAGLAQAVRRETRFPSELETIAVGSALGLCVIDVTFVTKRRIRPVYLLDAVIEAGLVAAWLRAPTRLKGTRRSVARP